MDKNEIDQNYLCLICTQYANQAVQTLCCGQLMCQVCANDLKKSHDNCPNCRQTLETKISAISRRIISTLKVFCKYQCGQKIVYKEIKVHEKKCPMRQTFCKICAQKIILKQLVDHFMKTHEEKVYQLFCNFQFDDQPSASQSKIKTFSKIGGGSMVASQIKNKKGIKCSLGVTGKYYCGQRNLIGKCSCCDGRCGPTNGQNCDDCMQADMQRFGLQKGFLVNPQGIVCKVDQDSGTYYCGVMQRQQGIFCTKEKPCWPCSRTKNAIKIGRYKQLV